MTIVTNQTELINALTQNETDIVVANDFTVSTILNIEYVVTIRSLEPAVTLLKGATFFGNIIRIRNGGSLTLQNIILDGNKANHPIDNNNNRSLLLVAGGSLNLQENVIIQNNVTYLEGGGVYLSGSTDYVNHFHMGNNAIIRGCYARTNGGGFVAAIRNNEDQVVIEGESHFEDNEANYGGGFYYRIYTIGVKGSATISGQPVFQNNVARNSGAAIAVVNITGNTENISMDIAGSPIISNNIANNHGAGIYFVGTNALDQLQLGSVQIERNTATNYGGGVYVTGGIVSFTGTTIASNQAGTGGGVCFLSNTGGTLEIASSSFLANTASKGASGSGGGLWLNNQSTTVPFHIKIRDTSMTGNVASAAGGGVYLVDRAPGLVVQFERLQVDKNRATTNGAGLFLAAGGAANIDLIASTIHNNNSGNYGGGLYVSNENDGTASLFLQEMEISNNQAVVQGGGLRLASGLGRLEALIEDCTITQNVVQTNSGGGLWCGGSAVFVTLSKTTSVTENETLEGNGGGIYFNSQTGILRLDDDSKVNNNLAVQNTSLVRNRGGGIYLIPGVLYMTGNSEIAFNKAQYGGGVATGEGVVAIISGGSIHNNEALFGGGIYNQASTIYLENSTIYGNQATSYAPGIYNGGNLYAKEEVESEDGVYIPSLAGVIQINGPLSSQAVIQLSSSDYVAPDVERAPIVVATATTEYPLLMTTDLEAFRKPVTGFERWRLYLNANATQILLAPTIIEEYSITYQNLRGTTHKNPSVYTPETPTFSLLPPTSLKCQYFMGWFDENNQLRKEISFGTEGNIALTARWESLGNCDKKACTNVFEPVCCKNRNCSLKKY